MDNKWIKKDDKLEVLNFVAKKGQVKRHMINAFLGENENHANNIINQLVSDSSISVVPSADDKDMDIVKISAHSQKKSFNDFY